MIDTTPGPVIHGDAEQYYEIAKALVGKGGSLSYDRNSWGYPIFLILTGVPWSRWPVITQLLQVGMASAIPYLVGASLRQVGVASRISVAAAIASFLTLPTVFSISLLTDTCGEFLLYVAIWLVARSLTRIAGAAAEPAINRQTRWQVAAAIGAVFFLLYLVRPANALLGIIGLSACLAATATAGRGVMLRAMGVLIVLTLAWMPLQKGWTAWVETKAKQTFQTEGSEAGLLFFRNVYAAGSTFVGRSTIAPDNGPCSARVYASVDRNLATIGDGIMKTYNRSATTDEIFATHDDIHLMVIWQSVEHDFGPKEMDRIFWCAAFEGVYAEPKSLLYLYDGLIAFFLVDDLIYDNGYRQAWRSVGDYTTANRPLWAWAMYAGAAIKVIAVLIALGTVVPTWQRGGSQRALAAMLWGMVLYLAASHVVFASAHWRYITPVIPALVMLAALGVHAVRDPCADPRVHQRDA